MKKILFSSAVLVVFISTGIISKSVAKNTDSFLNPSEVTVTDTLPAPNPPSGNHWNAGSDTTHPMMDTGKMERSHKKWEKGNSHMKYHKQWNGKKDTFYNYDTTHPMIDTARMEGNQKKWKKNNHFEKYHKQWNGKNGHSLKTDTSGSHRNN